MDKATDYDIDLLIRYLKYSEIELWRVGRNIMFYSSLGKLKKSVKEPKDLFELEDEIYNATTEASDKQKMLFEQIKKRTGNK